MDRGSGRRTDMAEEMKLINEKTAALDQIDSVSARS
jgi:hypothetical protein